MQRHTYMGLHDFLFFVGYGLFFLGRNANQKKARLAYLFFLIRLSRVHRHFDDPIPSTSNGGSEMA